MTAVRHLSVRFPAGGPLDALRCLQVVLGHQRTPIDTVSIERRPHGEVEATLRTGPLSDHACEQLRRRLERRGAVAWATVPDGGSGGREPAVPQD